MSDRDREALRALSRRLVAVLNAHHEREFTPRLVPVDHPGPVETDEPPADEEPGPEVGS